MSVPRVYLPVSLTGPDPSGLLGRPDFVEAALALPGDPRFRLPPASPRRYYGEATVVFHLRPKQQRLVAH